MFDCVQCKKRLRFYCDNNEFAVIAIILSKTVISLDLIVVVVVVFDAGVCIIM